MDANGISWICLEQALGLTWNVVVIKANSKHFSAHELQTLFLMH